MVPMVPDRRSAWKWGGITVGAMTLVVAITVGPSFAVTTASVEATPSAAARSATSLEALPVATKFADTILSTWPDASKLNPKKGFEYTNGIILSGLSRVYLKTKDERYLTYIRSFFDTYVDASGNVTFKDSAANLDYIQPGNVLIFLYQQTHDKRYKTAARQVYERLTQTPKNAEGGYWHKEKYPNQMWADSAYQGYLFSVAYGVAFGDQAAVDEGVKQMLLFAKHGQLENGLVRHAWDQSKQATWANPTTGLSPVVWDRATGWYAMALADILGMIPQSHPGYSQLQQQFQQLAKGIAATQDSATGLWYQVMDQPTATGNFIETSGSAFLITALLQGADGGQIDSSYRKVAMKGWAGLGAHITQTSTGIELSDAVEGMGVSGTVAEYVDHQRLTNSPHGLIGAQLAAVTVAGVSPAPTAARS